jgi:AcrR family transcriptional regulator
MSEHSLTYTALVPSRHERAGPLPPDDRRRAIIEAVIPLLLERGSAVTTREMAEAAGIAEGTIFRVFPDKPSVIHEAVKATMDPEPIRRALAAIPTRLPMGTQLREAAHILMDRGERLTALFGILRAVRPPSPGPPAGARQYVIDANAATRAALAVLLQRHEDRLRIPPERAAVAFQGFVLAGSHPLIAPDKKATPEEMVDILLNGILASDREGEA